MRYFGNPCTPTVRDAMNTGALDMIATPRQRIAIPPRATWCADNGCFGDGYPGDDAWLAWLGSFTPDERARCAFATAPDVVADAAATLTRSAPWLSRIRALGYPAALVAQNGLDPLATPWATFDALFLGGDTAWKLGPQARALTAEAKRRGKWVHMGRVNSARRLRYATAIGCDSADGTYLTRGPDRNLPNVLSWLRQANEQGALTLELTS